MRGLRKSYAGREVIRGADLEVGEGEVVALLGPNGAGKTTTLEILEGYRPRDSGEVSVLGGDPARHDPTRLARIGICLQATGIERYLTCAEVLALYGGYYPTPQPARDVLELVGLTEQADVRVRRLSGGQRRRLDLALALVGDPELLFLDEPTTGFDAEARRQAWELVRGLVRTGRTVLLTTHSMDEAQALADRLVVIVGGSIVAQGTAGQIIGKRAMGSMVRFRLAADAPDLPGDLASVARRGPDGTLDLPTTEPTRLLHGLTGWAVGSGVELRDLTVARPSLEDAYLDLVAEHTPVGAGPADLGDAS